MTAPTLFLLHGFMGSSLNWGPLSARLKKRPELEGWQIKAGDMLGHGGRRGEDALAYSELTHEILVEDLKRQLPDGPYVAMGHSFGIRPLLSIAGEEQGRGKMKALFVEDASPEITGEARGRLRGIVEKVPVPFEDRQSAKASIDSLFPDDPVLANFLFSNIRKQEDGLQSWRFDKDGLLKLLDESFNQPLWEEWSNWSGPTWIFRGELSDHLTEERLQRALERGPGGTCEVVKVANSGHWIHSEQPESFCDEVVRAVGSLGKLS